METSICRACLQPEACGDSKFANLFMRYSVDDGTNALLLCEMLSSCTNTLIQQGDNLPNCICSKCFSTLMTSYKFKVACENSYKWLLDNYQVIKVKDEHNYEYESFKCNIPIENERAQSPKGRGDLFYSTCRGDIRDVKVEQTMTCSPYNEELDSDFYRIDNFETPTQKIRSLEDAILEARQTKSIRTKKYATKKRNLKKSDFPKTLQCSQCPKMFSFPHLLRKHTETHRGIKSYFCPTCEKCYKSETDHNKTHKNRSKFMCDICSKCFNTKQKVYTHLKTHAADRPKSFVCEVPGCDKAYLSVQGLNRHKILHSGTKNFLCHLCSKAFSDKAGLVLHMSFHYNERNFKCRFCEKDFFTPSNRNQHEQRHSERRYPCGQCDKRFHNRVALNRHVLTHTNQLQHQCAYCVKKFARIDNKKRHELVIHGCSSTRDKNVIIGRTSPNDKPL